ncbi:D-alanyl-D-alanine carboxypeptidase [Candidatus Arthromitus sp. SFB-mouse-Japan]|uniref:D-alanyl-D-alanine carboxypeptidase family protein n=1 Tax=Candidatus Arthromitus sp. SFB-mouse TaxID=49118 RepID=UPI00021B7F2F|nr:serine hydrolase [Candidatus Arthromitus sp. SFB-mouse]EIA22591.1 D-alanyl-D-alanine carboxypeptidase [Candidatus Arthromitus sp. SFB-2]EIA24071.1 D-alanyl-D-alanine carboxypeptidase [Candidatus Arthromitus sp. SFB-1]EIA25347.1 D-alanyl-D-alanine carboxypeptidase [Candidatus Arthromitus sp. SFB-4]EIA28340.1 D-alanyl-D-alanine carboxypeptidase [Candidatus Arthromitus sp. SFB-co]EIA29916.1 D-alanyl-D-alanine carboxypeptidase [Candidatus Arthromitus sp. SFB-mouse-SU]EIA31656.1 D-alanyl-D-alan
MRIFKSVLFGVLFSFIVGCLPVHAINDTSNGTDVEARSAILMEVETGKIVFDKNSKEKFAPASVTKVMTMLLTMEAVDSGKIKLDDVVTVTENAQRMGGSTMLLEAGELRTVEDLLKGVAIASGNDAAVALAEYLGGSVENFVKKMNDRARELGMKDTTFQNPTGLPTENHLTTAYDISIMSRELLKHETILKYSGTYMETISTNRKTPIELVNHNKLVRFFNGCDGLKTGFTNEAKYCISATAQRNGVRMLCIIMGAPTYKIRNRDASMLLNYGFSLFERKEVIQQDSEISKLQLGNNKDNFIILKAAQPLSLVVEKANELKITTKLDVDKSKKNIKQGDIMGTAIFLIDGKEAGRVEVYSDRDMKNSSVFDKLFSIFKKGDKVEDNSNVEENSSKQEENNK